MNPHGRRSAKQHDQESQKPLKQSYHREDHVGELGRNKVPHEYMIRPNLLLLLAHRLKQNHFSATR
jgi:hypothetical protein